MRITIRGLSLCGYIFHFVFIVVSFSFTLADVFAAKNSTETMNVVTQVTTMNDVDSKVTLSIDSSKCSHIFHFKLLRLTYLTSLSFFPSCLDKRDGDSADDSILDY